MAEKLPLGAGREGVHHQPILGGEAHMDVGPINHARERTIAEE